MGVERLVIQGGKVVQWKEKESCFGMVLFQIRVVFILDYVLKILVLFLLLEMIFDNRM